MYCRRTTDSPPAGLGTGREQFVATMPTLRTDRRANVARRDIPEKRGSGSTLADGKAALTKKPR